MAKSKKRSSAKKNKPPKKRLVSARKKVSAAKRRARKTAKSPSKKKTDASRKRASGKDTLERPAARRVRGRCEMTYNGNVYCEDGISEAECMRKPQHYIGATVRFFPNQECPK